MVLLNFTRLNRVVLGFYRVLPCFLEFQCDGIGFH